MVLCGTSQARSSPAGTRGRMSGEQVAENSKAGRLRQGSEPIDGEGFVHDSTITVCRGAPADGESPENPPALPVPIVSLSQPYDIRRHVPDISNNIQGSDELGKFPETAAASAPAQAGGDMLEDRLDDVGVVVDTELIGDGQEQRVSLGDGFVFRELLDEDVRLSGVAAAKNGSGVVAEEADLCRRSRCRARNRRGRGRPRAQRCCG